MRGLMQDRPLLISSLIEFADGFHGDAEIVTRTVEGPIHRYTYRDAHRRAKQLANGLVSLGCKLGDRIATMAWNTHRHFEIYYAVSGLGAVCHTLNPRLFAEQLDYIVNHAEDCVMFVDLTFVPIIEGLQDKFPTVRHFVIMTDEANMPETGLRDVICYETLVESQSADFTWPEFDEMTASSLCYTSGTTGNPKGVLYAHRSTVLHSFAVCSRDVLSMSSQEAVLPVVPMFHANAWGLPYAAAMSGAKLVFPGPALDGPSVHELFENEKVTMSAGVPTVWLALLNYLKESGKSLSTVERLVIGGSAAPKMMIETFERDYGAEVIHAWGMTEMSPLGTTGNLKRKHLDVSFDDQVAVRMKQGRGVYGVEMKIIDDEGNDLPHDGVAFGHLMVRGPWIVSEYFKGDGGDILDKDGWFDTGDVATLDQDGYMQITDRSKDVIKSGGEWISSIDMENMAVGHPGIAEAAVIGLPHPKWDERPLLIVVRAAGSEITADEVRDYLTDKIAKWWMPDDIAFVDELPHGPTGKILKTKLREDFEGHVLPTV